LLVLAAGEGSRMRSRTPKLLHPVCDRSILRHVVRMGQELGAKPIAIVVGADEDAFREELRGEPVEFVRQPEPLGTGHATLQARELLQDHAGPVIVMAGDHPLYSAGTFRGLVDDLGDLDLLVVTCELPETPEFGRIVRGDDGGIRAIVEHRDATPEQRAIAEVGLSLYVARPDFLFETLARVGNDNAQGEHYLTDIVALGLEAGASVGTSKLEDWTETLGINSRVDLAEAEQLMRRRIARHWMSEGVSFEDPERTYVGADVTIGPDTVLAPGVSLRGRTQIGSGCRISEGCVIEASTVGDDVFLKPNCHIESSTLGNRCVVGPSAHLRPDNVLADGVRIGNFVELKNSRIGEGTKADHLSYIGDADVGAGCTIACGAITVNYDGAKKTRTVIGDGAFVGCNANLIAPVEVEPGSYVAAGSTITKQVPAGALSVARARQRNIEGWVERRFGGGNSDDEGQQE
jgi:bifunctional UDP-N-acetylglucosamine pyrophosphorylase/glucosamine-1-phosphate N-acetyltransferase